MTRARWRAFSRIAFCAALAAPPAAAAQQEGQLSAEQAAMMEKWAEYAAPGEEHARLAKAAGEWEWTSTWWMEPGGPAQTSSGTMSSEMTMDGRYLTERLEGSMWGQPFRGQSLLGYDNHLKEYFSTWIDNMGTGILMMRGTYDPQAKALTMTGTYDDIVDGKKKTMRSVTTHLDENTTRMEMYMEGPDGNEFKSMEVVSKRKGTS